MFKYYSTCGLPAAYIVPSSFIITSSDSTAAFTTNESKIVGPLAATPCPFGFALFTGSAEVRGIISVQYLSIIL